MDWFTVQDAVTSCGFSLDTMHPFALEVLSFWSRGLLDNLGMLSGVSLVDSDNLTLGECLIAFSSSLPI